MAAKRVIVVGCSGQDGTLLMNALSEQGADVLGICRPTGDLSRIPVRARSVNVFDACVVEDLVKEFKPQEVYYLAAHHVSSEFKVGQMSLGTEFDAAHSTHVVGLLNFLSAIASYCPKARTFYAASSLLFSGEAGEVQNEETALSPQGFYGLTKAQGMLLCKELRKTHNIFASVGILYNHESHLRASKFLSAKIIRTAIRIRNGSREKLEVGNLKSRVDWGYAQDYVSAFQQILALDTPDDFIVATGEAHEVQEFISIVFDYLGLDPEVSVSENPSILSRSPLVKIGDSTKLRTRTGWRPSYTFREFVIQLVRDHELYFRSDLTA